MVHRPISIVFAAAAAAAPEAIAADAIEASLGSQGLRRARTRLSIVEGVRFPD